ncbi:MAG: Fic family protein [Bacteroidetes bacterium]|nr:Fic family protein [Bacteroidota bacterium]
MNVYTFDRNKPFNNLPLLPPEIDLENDPDILKKLLSASRALSAINSEITKLPNPLMLVNTIAIQEARSSSEIENIYTTDDELYKAISDSKKEEYADPSTREVLRYREAMWSGYKAIIERDYIKTDSIIEIAQQINGNITGIRPPQARVVIRRGNSELRPGEVVYTPPRGEAVIEAFLNNLIDYLNNQAFSKTDPLLKMCIAHYQFEAIHPFQDGNGRTGRILNLLYLVHAGLLTQPVLYLSKYIIRNKDDYYHHLAGVTQRQHWKNWIIYMLDAVETTAIHTRNLITDISEQMNETYTYAKSKFKWYTRELNESIYSQPYIKAKTIGEILNKTSRTTITKYMAELTEAGILSPKKEGLEVYYLNNDLLRILGGN